MQLLGQVFLSHGDAVKQQQWAAFKRAFPHVTEASVETEATTPMFNCAWFDRKIMRQGYLVVTPQRLCFFATVLEGRVTEVPVRVVRRGMIRLDLTRHAATTDVGQVAIFEDLSRREVYEATAKVMAAQNLQILEQDLAQGSIRAEVRSGLPTWGEVVAAYVTDLPDGGVQLKVVSKKRAQWQIGEHDWANAVVNAVRIELDAFE